MKFKLKIQQGDKPLELIADKKTIEVRLSGIAAAIVMVLLVIFVAVVLYSIYNAYTNSLIEPNSQTPPSQTIESSTPSTEQTAAPNLAQPDNVVTTDKNETAVYITDTGTKYHRAGCEYLQHSSHELTLLEAKGLGYTPCKVCSPPQ